MDGAQKSTNYEPTEKEKVLLDVLLNPENRMKSITDVCKLAGCSRNVYYEAFAKSGFSELYKQKSTDIVRQSVAPVLNTFVREAQRGSFQHGKVLLEMAGVYSDKLEIKAEINNPFQGLTEDELRRLL
jgi:L-2-hydroxyglutarate oxidase LhgO